MLCLFICCRTTRTAGQTWKEGQKGWYRRFGHGSKFYMCYSIFILFYWNLRFISNSVCNSKHWRRLRGDVSFRLVYLILFVLQGPAGPPGKNGFPVHILVFFFIKYFLYVMLTNKRTHVRKHAPLSSSFYTKSMPLILSYIYKRFYFKFYCAQLITYRIQSKFRIARIFTTFNIFFFSLSYISTSYSRI